MTDKSIQEAVEVVENWQDIGLTINRNKETEKTLSVLLDLANRYLSVGCPEKKEIGEMRYGGCNPDEDRGYNQALDDYRLWLLKKLDGLEEVIDKYVSYKSEQEGCNTIVYHIKADKKELAQAIREHLTNQ